MLDRFKQYHLLISYVFSIGTVYCVIPLFTSINHAGIFDKYYSILLICSIALYGALFVKKEPVVLLKHLVLIGIVFSGVATMIFYILSELDIWFLFERNGKTWLGIGAVKTFIYLLKGILIAFLLWFLKLKIVKTSK